MHLDRVMFERVKRKLNRHLYYSSYGCLLVIFLGGGLIATANKLGFLRGHPGAICAAIALLLTFLAAASLPFAMNWYIRRSDVIRCPNCNENILLKPDWVSREGRCPKCKAELFETSIT